MLDDARSHHEPTCPYCGSANIEPLALFGQQLLTVQMYCQSCHTPFEYVKDDAIVRTFATKGTSNYDRHQ